MSIILPDKRILTRQPNGIFEVDRSSELLGNKTNIIVGSQKSIDVGSRKSFSTNTATNVTGPFGLEYYGTPSQEISTPNVTDGALPITIAAIFNGYISTSSPQVYYMGQRWFGGLYAFLECWDTTIGNFRTFSTAVTDGVYNYVVATIDESRLISFYVNGSLVGSVTAGNTQNDSAPESTIKFDTSTVYGRSPLLVKTNRAWSLAQVKAWQQNPWQVFAKPKLYVYGFSSSSAVTHDTSGALVGQLGSIAGSSARFRAHATTGALTGQLGGISGTARHNIPHTSSGALTGQGSTLSGAADRQPPGSVTHATTGSLVGQGSSLSGTAARLRVLTSSGALVGQGAIIAGSAVHNIPHSATGALVGQLGGIIGSASRTGALVNHATSGDLTGQGAALSGSALRSGASILTPQDLINIADAVWAHSSAVHCQLLLTEVWGRLGLDPAAPLISGTTEISFGSIVMALTEASGTVTVTRQ
jgi:hypothetical protein